MQSNSNTQEALETRVHVTSASPRKLITTYNADEWEEFIEEWAEGFEPRYDQVTRIGGAGDKGRDVIGHITSAEVRPRPCDIYQCKHYDHPLQPSEVYVELGKLCVFTFDKTYPVPRKYRFCPPRGIGPGLYNLLNNVNELKSELIANWAKYCEKGISKSKTYPLEGALRQYVDSFDFSIVWYLEPAEILSQHQRTKYFYRRFKVDPPKRPEHEGVPSGIQDCELPYIECLLKAYSDYLKIAVDVHTVPTLPSPLGGHFSNSRISYYIADSLNRFSREYFPGGFERVKTEILHGVEAVVLQSHPNGFERLLAVTSQAVALPLQKTEIEPYVGTLDKKGILHHLAGDGAVSWV
jgi:hypothetical protein